MTVIVSKPAVNLREKLAELDKPTGIAGEAMLRADTPQEQFELIGAGRKNLIINGDFQVSQRGDYASAPVAMSSGYMVDRWATWRDTITTEYQKLTAVIDGVTKNTFKVTATSSGTGYIGVRQLIEQQNIPAGQTVTISCWMRSNSKYARIRQNSLDNSNNDGPAHGGDGVWRKVTHTISNVSNASNFEMGVITYNNAPVPVSSGDYIEFTEFQLEFGSVATPFEHRSYGEELALCQRYYEVLGQEYNASYTGYLPVMQPNVSTGQSSRSASIAHQVTKRVVPTVGDIDMQYYIGSWVSVSNVIADGVNYTRVLGVSSTYHSLLRGRIYADAEL